MKASAAKGIKYGRGSVTGGGLFSLPAPLSSCDEQDGLWEGLWVTVHEEGNINTCFHISVFLLPGELQLANAGLASAVLLRSRRVQTSACSSLERDGAAWPDLSELLAPVQEDLTYLLLACTVLSRVFGAAAYQLKHFWSGFSACVVQAACKLGKCARLEEAEASIGVYRCLRSVCWEALLSPPPPFPFRVGFC